MIMLLTYKSVFDEFNNKFYACLIASCVGLIVTYILGKINANNTKNEDNL